jgi:hypothetical protein
MRHFLEEAGYLHIQGLFTEEEMGAVSEDMDRAAPVYAPNDGRSWWARTADGDGSSSGCRASTSSRRRRRR